MPTSSIRIRRRACCTLGSSGTSNYWEIETTGRYPGQRAPRPHACPYVRSHSTRDLNDYDQFFGNFRNPIIRRNENSLSTTDVPDRVIVRGSLGLAGSVGVHADLRMAERVSVVGGRRVPGLRRPAEPVGAVAHGLDPRLHAGAAVAGWKYRFTAGLKIYNTFDRGSERDVQTNVTAPDYGRFYNPIQRSIGFLVSSSR